MIRSKEHTMLYLKTRTWQLVGKVEVGQILHCDKIKLCRFGLHASFTEEDAKTYAPREHLLTRVAVWGRIIVDSDKLVATDREVIEISGVSK